MENNTVVQATDAETAAYLRGLASRPPQLGSSSGGPLHELFKAKAAARAKFTPIVRSKSVTVRTKDGRSYTFEYADLDAVLSATMPALSAHGLDLMWLGPMDDSKGGAKLSCLLTHESGAYICVDMMLPPCNSPQDRGSQLTYARRYQAQCILGVASEEDDDGNAAAGNDAVVSGRKPSAPRQEPRRAPQAPAPKAEPKAITGDKNEQTLSPVKTDKNTDAPIEPRVESDADDIGALSDGDIRQACASAGQVLGVHGNPTQAAKLCIAITGKPSKELDRAGWELLLRGLRERVNAQAAESAAAL
jgi:hypothetical protein